MTPHQRDTSGAAHQARDHLVPDERLHIFRHGEILLHLGQHVGQIGERPGKVRAAAGRPAAAKDARDLPGLLRAGGHLSGKVVGAHQQRIIVQRLRGGRLVVGVIEAHQSVAHERREFASRVGQFRG